VDLPSLSWSGIITTAVVGRATAIATVVPVVVTAITELLLVLGVATVSVVIGRHDVRK
jgi:hypothetical protein